MDFLSLVAAGSQGQFNFPEEMTETMKRYYGADLWRFTKTDGPAKAVSLSGVWNYTNYGVRNMVSTTGALYLGMANPMNLLTNPADEVPEGGWELIQLTIKKNKAKK